MLKPKSTFRPITPEESAMLAKLGKCSFLPGHPDKRFVQNMQGATQISEGQTGYLRKLAYKYRRQM